MIRNKNTNTVNINLNAYKKPFLIQRILIIDLIVLILVDIFCEFGFIF